MTFISKRSRLCFWLINSLKYTKILQSQPNKVGLTLKLPKLNRKLNLSNKISRISEAEFNRKLWHRMKSAARSSVMILKQIVVTRGNTEFGYACLTSSRLLTSFAHIKGLQLAKALTSFGSFRALYWFCAAVVRRAQSRLLRSNILRAANAPASKRWICSRGLEEPSFIRRWERVKCLVSSPLRERECRQPGRKSPNLIGRTGVFHIVL